MPHRSHNLKKILYIEDDEGLARLLQKRMERQRFEIDLSFTGEDGLKKLKENDYDLVLLDYNLPGMSGLDLLQKIQPISDYPPVIMLTAGGDERIALNALEGGAADYAVKDANQLYLDLLPAVMQSAYTKDRLMRENEKQHKELEIARQKADAANQAKTEFLATMSHEIRTPMNAVVGLSQLLSKTNLDDKQKRMVDTIRANADILMTLINDLIDLSRIDAKQVNLQREVFSLKLLLENVYATFSNQAKEKNLLLDFQIDKSIIDRNFVGDSLRLQQILLNLISNALKFTSHGSITVHAYCKNGTTTISVSDTGIGIEKDKLDLIFDRFAQADQSITRRFGGSGLGLSISKALAEMMNGKLTVESVPGSGSSFTLNIKLEEAPVSHETSKSESISATASASGKILLVEDYPANIMVASLMLESLGYSVDVAKSGQEALGKFENFSEPYHAILMDVQMQDMDGLEATQRIRQWETAHDIKRHLIIGVTAHALAGDREKCLQAGMDDYISKPIHQEILSQKLLQAQKNS